MNQMGIGEPPPYGSIGPGVSPFIGAPIGDPVDPLKSDSIVSARTIFRDTLAEERRLCAGDYGGSIDSVQWICCLIRAEDAARSFAKLFGEEIQ